jgi:hypothetical protein
MKPLSHAQGRRAYPVSGSHGLKRALSRGGLSALDGRSAAARAVWRSKAEVEADLGAELPTAERTCSRSLSGGWGL